ncbi:MAG TPA: ABC transporter permease [Gammaproteobacteria bacterium]|nr:ABC transporter permease [Gammaproteobacteria bacterium]
MHEWSLLVRPHLASLQMDPAREAEIVEEISQHLEQRYEELLAGGATEDAARRLLTQELRESDALSAQLAPLRQAHAPRPIGPSAPRGRLLDGLWRDLRIAVRALRKSPGFAAAAVLTLALAIGANTAIFSIVDAVLLDPLGFPDSDRLVSIRATAPGSDLPGEFEPAGEFYLQYKDAKALEDLAYYNMIQTTMRADDNVERLFIASVSASLFSTLRVKPLIGRLPTEADETGQVVVLSHWLWMAWFAGDPAVLGRTVDISNGQRTVIGVMGPEFRFPEEQAAVWLNSRLAPSITPGNFGVSLVGRLAPGADRAQLIPELAALAQRLPERFGGSAAYARIIERHQPVVRSLEEWLVGGVKRPLWILMGTVGIVLAIACANVANLLIVRAESRRKDTAVRRALGAGRAAVIRSQIAEAVVLATAGGVAGLVLAWVSLPLLVRAAPENIPRLGAAGIDSAALLFCAGVAIVAALLSGLLPAIRFSGFEIADGLRDQRGGGSRRDRHWVRDALVVTQTSAALVLLIGSGLLFQSVRELRGVDPGFETRDIFTFQTAPDFRAMGVTDGPSAARFHYDFMDRLAALPGVQSVGLVDTLPLDEGARLRTFATENTGAGATEPLLRMTFASGDYFQTMGIRLLGGNYFPRNAEPSPNVGAIVSKSAAETLWPGEDPLGKRLRPAGTRAPVDWLTVTGVVEDVMLNDFRQETPDPLIYLPLVGQTAASWVVGTPAYVVKSPRAESIAPEIRGLIREFAPSAPMYRVFTMDGLAARTMADLSFTMLTLAIAAALAMILGAVGIYGTLSYMVSQRVREIGIRMALGAGASQVRRMIVTQGGRIVLIGVAAGVLAALLVTRLLDSLLFRVPASDALTFVGMSVFVVAIALLASYLPARRASSVDPLISLRTE